MRKNLLTALYLAAANLICSHAVGSQALIAGVPNYDQDIFPIDSGYGAISGVGRGDCVPVACAMLHGYYDANGWPRLIPYGGNSVVSSPSDNPIRPYPGNAWGIDSVVRKYKTQFNWTAEGGVYFSSWSTFLGNPLGDGLLAVISYFEPNAAFTREDDDITSWSRIQSFISANRPCVLVVWPRYNVFPLFHNYNDSYKWEGSSTLNELGGGHAVCAVGWSDVGGRWVMCNMGWLYTSRGWFNYDSDDDWYISQIAPGGSPSGEDDDAYEDNDVIGNARSISTGTINNLRCLDTLVVSGNYLASYGDWYKVNASSGQNLTVTISFTHANGDLDLRVYTPNQLLAGSSDGTANSESVTVASTSSGYYYIFVYGYNNAKNQNYSLTVGLSTSTIAVIVQASPSGRSFSVDGALYSTAQTFNWTPTSSHTIAASSPQSGATGVQYAWSSWSDGGAISHIVSPSSGTTYTADFATQYYLTMTTGTGGAISPGSGWYNAGADISITATPSSGYSFNNWTGSGNGSYSGSSSSTSVTMNAPITEAASFTQNPISVTVQPNPSGRTFTVDGTSYTTAQTFNWIPTSSHTIAASSPQSAATGVQYAWSAWSDGGAISHTVSPSSATSYTANFVTQYYLTMTAGTGGAVSPSSGWYNAGAGVSISASPSSGYSFNIWTGSGNGSYSGNNNPSSITMNGPVSESAAFNSTPGTISVTVQSSPPAASFSVDGTTYSGAQMFSWPSGSSHNIGTTSPQAGAAGVQYFWNNWSDSGGISHEVSPTSAITYTANFTTQYYLTMSSGVGGGASPSSGWYSSGTGVTISATPTSGYAFAGWTGSGSGSYSGQANPASLTMNEPIKEAASFSSSPSACIAAPSGLVAWWPGNGHAFSITGPVSAGMLSNNATYADGLIGKGFSVFAAPDGVIVPDTPGLHLESFTIEGWMKRARTNQSLWLFACPSGGYGLVIRTIGRIEFVHQDISWITSPYEIQDTEFHHVAVTRSANAVVFYLDAVASAAFEDPGTLNFHGNCGIGNDASLSSNPAGIVDEVAIYDRALTPSEVQGIFAAGAKGKCADALLPRLLPPLRLTDSNVEVKLLGEAGNEYILLASENLVNWGPIASKNAVGPLTTFIDSAAAGSSRFYRAVSEVRVETAFSDNFDRPDSDVVGNGWINAPSDGDYHLAIRNQRLSVNPLDPLGAGVYRRMPSLPVSVAVRFTGANGYGTLRYRYQSRVAVLYDPSTGKGYGFYFTRADEMVNDSTITIFDGDTAVASLRPSFQFEANIDVTAMFKEDGSLSATISSGQNSFNFALDPRPIQSTGGNVGIHLNASNNGTPPILATADDFSIAPVVNLISNGDFEAGNTAFTSEYLYTAQIASASQYRIGSTSRDWPGDAIGGDHTTGHGLMMVVNGSDSSTAVWQQMVEVAPNTSYTLSAWVASWSNPDKSPARLDFQLNGSSAGILGMPSSQVPADSLWQHFTGTWNSGPSTSATIRIIDLNSQSDGNDFCLDDISMTASP